MATSIADRAQPRVGALGRYLGEVSDEVGLSNGKARQLGFEDFRELHQTRSDESSAQEGDFPQFIAEGQESRGQPHHNQASRHMPNTSTCSSLCHCADLIRAVLCNNISEASIRNHLQGKATCQQTPQRILCIHEASSTHMLTAEE
jgi:hypothetical protein